MRPETGAQQVATEPTRPKFGIQAKLCLLLFTFVLLVLLDVAAARLYAHFAGHPYTAGNPARLYRIAADPYHHGLAPNFSTDGADWGGHYRFRTNSLGFKDATVRDVPLKPQGRRIVVIGDSFTEGVGVPYEDTFAGRLGSALAPGTEVLNAGVQSYTPIIYYRKIKYCLEQGLQFDEVIVAVDESDVRNELEYELVDDVVRPRSFKERVVEALKRNSIVPLTIAELLRGEQFSEASADQGANAPSAADAAKLATDAEIEKALWELPGVGNAAWTHNEEEWRAYGKAGSKSMVENMDRLLAVLKARGIGLTVVVYPWPDQIVAGDPECRQVTIWRDWCKKRSARFVDSFPKFEVGAPWKRRAEILDRYFIRGDQHFTAEGHRLVADAILDVIRPRK